ncbi:hypothetical protein IAQ61_000698 [Plenodomus lingam]|uniref:uncharacterized protein n=1 Tax=Leptosphaeria maculans TaxID=5022 RepID=UPI00332C8619|nr:hypothetical protein IAQ61_000698 [Plenodomus lingam]
MAMTFTTLCLICDGAIKITSGVKDALVSLRDCTLTAGIVLASEANNYATLQRQVTVSLDHCIQQCPCKITEDEAVPE